MLHGKFQLKGKKLTLGEVPEAIMAQRKLFVVVAIMPSDHTTLEFGIGVPSSLTLEPSKNRARVEFPETFFSFAQEFAVAGRFPKGVDLKAQDYIADIDNDVSFYEVEEQEVKSEDEFYEAVARISGRFHRKEISAEEMAYTIDRFWNP